MLSVRTSLGVGRYSASAPGEYDAIFRTSQSGPPLIWCHGNNGSTLGDYLAYNSTFRLLAQRFRVYVADLGGNTFGNDTGISRMVDMVAYTGSPKVFLLGASMGAAVALNYAKRNPTKIEAVACVIPAVDLSYDLGAGHPATINLNAAYPPSYNDATLGADYNPVRYASTLPSTMPIHLFTSSNDTTTVPSTATEFVTARPNTERTVIGAYGHAGVNESAQTMYNWLTKYL